MAKGVNKVILVGNVGGDPEVRYMPSGSAVANISVATSETWKDKQTGQPQERTEWHKVVFFNKLAEIVEKYVRKGSKLYIEGSLRTKQWEQDGVKRYSTEIVADQMQMLDSQSSQNGNYQGQQQQQGQYQQQPPQGHHPNAGATTMHQPPQQQGGYQQQAPQGQYQQQQGGYDQPPPF